MELIRKKYIKKWSKLNSTTTIKTVIQAHLTDTFQDVINKYTQKALLDPKSLCFLANGKVIDPEKTVESHMNQLNKENKKWKYYYI